MKIIGLMLIKDEDDILEDVIEYHMAQGLDGLLVCDNGSTDGTMEILKHYYGTAVLEVYTYDKFFQDRITTQLAHIAYTKFGADWVIPIDADEFSTCLSSLKLRDLLSLINSRSCLNIGIPRRFYWPTVYDNVSLPAYERFRYWRYQYNPKAIIKCTDTMNFESGCHVANNGFERSLLDRDNHHLVVRHFQYRSFQQTKKRLLNISDVRKYIRIHHSDDGHWDYLQRRFGEISKETVDEIATVLWHELFLSSSKVHYGLKEETLYFDGIAEQGSV